MKKFIIATMVTTMALGLIGCSGGGTTNTTVEPAPVAVEVVILPAGVEQTQELFKGVRVAYDVNEHGVGIVMTMLDNVDIDLYSFVIQTELEDGTVLFTEPNAEREDNRVTLGDTVSFTKEGRYTISVLYYGSDDYQLSKKSFDYVVEATEK